MGAVAASYEVRWRLQGSNGAWNTRIFPARGDSVELTGLERGQTYDIEARALSEAGTPSDWVPVTVLIDDATLAPRAPTNLVAQSVADGVALSWQVDAEQAADVEYIVERAASDSGPWVEVARVRATRWTDPADDEAINWYRVKAKTFGGVSSAYSNTVSEKATTPARIFDQATEPANPRVGYLWRDTVNKVIKRWDGAKWAFYAADAMKKNLIVNPTGLHDYDGWTSWVGSGRQRMTTRTESFGRAFACDFPDSTNSYDMGAAQLIRGLAGGTAYTLSASVYGFHMGSGSVYAEVRFLNSSGQEIDSAQRIQLFADVVGNQVERLAGTRVSPAGTAQAQVIIRATGVSGSGAGSFFRWWDLKFEQSDFPTPFSDDSTPRVSPLDNYLDTGPGGAGRWRIGLRVHGSGHRLGSQSNAPQSLTTAYGSVRDTTALTASSSGAVSVNAHVVRYGGFSVSYNAVANAVTGLTANTRYVIYCFDPDYTGGTKTWYAGPNPDAVMQLGDGVVIAGEVTIPNSGTSSGGGGSGGGDNWCVDATMRLPDGRIAGDVAAGDIIACWDENAAAPGVQERDVESNTLVESQPCTRIMTVSGAAVVASDCTPMTLRDGRIVRITQMFGEDALVRHADGTLAWEPVVSCTSVGSRTVAKIKVHQLSYFAGESAAATIATHNPIAKP